MHAPPASSRSPSVAAALIPALLPLPFHLAAGVLLWAVMSGESRTGALSYLFDAGGTAAWGVLGAATLTAMVNTALLPLSVRIRALPAALPLLLALAPWLVGVAGVLTGMQAVESAVMHVNPLDQGIILAVGLSEALGCAVLGGWFAAPQLAAVALGLGIGSVGQRAPQGQKQWALAGAGALVALPLLLPFLQLGAMGAVVAVPALIAAVSLLLAGLGLGRDAQGRSGTLALVASVAGAAAVGAAGAASLSRWLAHGYEALANVAPPDRATILTAVLAEFLDARGGLTLALLALGVAVAVLAVGAARLSPTKGRVLGALALSLLAVVSVAAVERVALTRSMRSVGVHLGGGTVVAVGLEPLVFPDGKTSWAPGLVVHADGRMEWSLPAAHLDLTVDAEGVARWLEQQAREVETMRNLRELAGDPDSPLLEGGEVVIAVDRRARGADLMKAVRLAQAGGATHLGLYGELETAPPLDGHARVIEAFPFVASLAKQEAVLQVVLPAGMGNVEELDAHGWRARIEKGQPLRISPRPGSAESHFTLTGAREVPRRSEGEYVHLEVDWASVDGATLADWLWRLEGAGYRGVLHPDGLAEAKRTNVAEEGAR